MLAILLRRYLREECLYKGQEQAKERRKVRAGQRAAFGGRLQQWRAERLAAMLAKMIEEGQP